MASSEVQYSVQKECEQKRRIIPPALQRLQKPKSLASWSRGSPWEARWKTTVLILEEAAGILCYIISKFSSIIHGLNHLPSFHFFRWNSCKKNFFCLYSFQGKILYNYHCVCLHVRFSMEKLDRVLARFHVSCSFCLVIRHGIPGSGIHPSTWYMHLSLVNEWSWIAPAKEIVPVYVSWNSNFPPV